MELAAPVDHVLVEGDQAEARGWVRWARVAATKHLVAVPPVLGRWSGDGELHPWRQTVAHGATVKQGKGGEKEACTSTSSSP